MGREGRQEVDDGGDKVRGEPMAGNDISTGEREARCICICIFIYICICICI